MDPLQEERKGREKREAGGQMKRGSNEMETYRDGRKTDVERREKGIKTNGVFRVSRRQDGVGRRIVFYPFVDVM